MKFTFGTLPGTEMLDTLQRLGIDLGSGSNKVVCDYGAGYAHIAQAIAALPSVSQVNCIDEDYPEAGEKIVVFRSKINEIQKLEDFQSITPYDHFLYGLRKKVIVRFQEILAKQGGLNDKISFQTTTKGLPDGSQDIVMANFLFSNLEFIHEVLFDCRRLLKENGVLIITDHSESFAEQDGLIFIMKMIKELGILCPENEKKPFNDDPYGIKTLRINVEDLDKIIQKMLEGTPETGLKKITTDLNKVYPSEAIDGEEPESEPWEIEYTLIPYERIAKQILSPQEISLLKKIPHFKLEDYTKARFMDWEDIIIERETPGEKLLRTHMMIFERQNGRGGYECSDNVDQEEADFIAKTIEI